MHKHGEKNQDELGDSQDDRLYIPDTNDNNKSSDGLLVPEGKVNRPRKKNKKRDSMDDLQENSNKLFMILLLIIMGLFGVLIYYNLTKNNVKAARKLYSNTVV